MHYYQFNIADYRKDTGHLTPVEHYIYRWLIDEYHLSEQPLINNMPKLLRKMCLDESHRQSLEMILDEYFKPACDHDYQPVDLSLHPEYADVGEYPELCQYWIHNRMERDIDSYRKFIENKSAAGKASAMARKGKSNTCSTPVQHIETSEQLTNNHKPITNNHSNSRFTPPTLEEVREYCSSRSNGVDHQKFHDFYTAKGWVVGKNKMKDWKAAVRTWEKNSSPTPAKHDPYENYI